MRYSHLAIVAAALAILGGGNGAARAFDETPYPDWKGHWSRTGQKFPGQPSYDDSKPSGRGQQAPLTAEYEAVYDANEKDQQAGGFGTTTGWWCNAWGMPAMMIVFQPMEIVITPDVTYMLTSDTQFTVRRIFTDGRDWPAEFEPSYRGFSLGKWIDAAGSGRYDTLEIETRGFTSKGRAFTMRAGFPCMPTTRASSKSAFRSTGPIATCFATRLPSSTMR